MESKLSIDLFSFFKYHCLLVISMIISFFQLKFFLQLLECLIFLYFFDFLLYILLLHLGLKQSFVQFLYFCLVFILSLHFKKFFVCFKFKFSFLKIIIFLDFSLLKLSFSLKILLSDKIIWVSLYFCSSQILFLSEFCLKILKKSTWRDFHIWNFNSF